MPASITHNRAVRMLPTQSPPNPPLPVAPESHKHKLSETARLVRDITSLIDQERMVPRQQTYRMATGAAAIACLARQNLVPSALKESALMLSLTGTAPVEDATPFARELTRAALPVSNLKKSFQIKLGKLISDRTNREIFADPLLPAWVFETARKQPRSAILKLDSGAETARAGRSQNSLLNLPELTQWFTPDWISRFLVDQAVDGTDCEIFDPACGAGNIIVHALDCLVEKSDKPVEAAVKNALEKSLFGCDIDPEVIETAKLSIYLACRKLVKTGNLPQPQLFHFGLNESLPEAAAGSLWLGADPVPSSLIVWGPRGKMKLVDSPLARKFSAVITNPPYLSHRVMPGELARFMQSHYPDCRFDLYAGFISLCLRLVKTGGLFSLICQQSFMTTKRYRKLRKTILAESRIKSIVQLGAGTFGPAGGEKVNNAILTARKETGKSLPSADSVIKCWRILSPDQKKKAEAEGIKAQQNQLIDPVSFQAIPGSPFSFWCPSDLAAMFKKHPPLESGETQIVCINGLFTCNNKRFVRKHNEVSIEDRSGWRPYDKGGGHKWYRTTPFLVYWGDDGGEIRNYRASRGQSRSLPGESYYGRQGVTYSYIGTRGFRARLLSPDSIFDIASSSIFSNTISIHYLLGLLNSSLMRFLLGVLNPTINFQIGDLRRLPFAPPDQTTHSTVVKEVKRAVEIAKELDSYDRLSPFYGGPALARLATDLKPTGGARASDEAIRQAYALHVDEINKINRLERRIQKKIDRAVFDLYEVTGQNRNHVLADPWVTSSQGPVSRVPSLTEALAELSAFNEETASK